MDNSPEVDQSFQYDWQPLLKEALLELDHDKLKDRIAAAEIAIVSRRVAIANVPHHVPECHAIEDALSSLRVLKREVIEGQE